MVAGSIRLSRPCAGGSARKPECLEIGPRLAGAGGFINISQTAKAVYFVGTFTAGEAEIAIENGALRILKEGGTAKFVEEVEHRTFSGAYALKRGQPVLYITSAA